MLDEKLQDKAIWTMLLGTCMGNWLSTDRSANDSLRASQIVACWMCYVRQNLPAAFCSTVSLYSAPLFLIVLSCEGSDILGIVALSATL